jgi:hypothetical protein
MSFIIFTACSFNEILNIKGNYGSIWYLSLKNYICVLIIVSLNILIRSNFMAYLLPLSIGITTFFLFIIFLILNHFGILLQFNSKGSIFPSLSSPLLYLTIILISSLGFILDYSIKLINFLNTKRLASWLLINRSSKGQKKNSLNVTKVQSYKPYRTVSKGLKRYSVPFKEVSRDFLVERAPSFLNNLNREQIGNNKNNGFFKYKSGKSMQKI